MSAISTGELFQSSVYAGINLENILYGMELFLYFKTMHILLRLRADRKHRKSDVFYAFFSSTMLFLITVWVSTQAIFGEKMWITDTEYPGGPDGYWNKNISVWYMDLGTTAIVVLQLMTDALMIYRCRMIWNSYHAIILPSFLWLITLALGVMVDWVTSVPEGNFFTGVASKIGLSYYAVSVLLNTTVTCMICYRMVRHGRTVEEQLGEEYASRYFAIVAIVVESVLPYTLSGIAFLISLGIRSATSVTFVCVYILLMCISPQMLILRVVVGRAWEENAGKPPGSTIKFSPGVTSQFGESVGQVHLQTLSPKAYLDHGDGNV